jgi:hypothetical protein
MKPTRLLAVVLIAVVLPVGLVGPATASATAPPIPTPSHVEGVLPDGSTYVMDVPANWNRTVLLYSHGYVPDGAANPAFNAPSDAVRRALLDAGYAQIGSSYPETGWGGGAGPARAAGHP